MRTLYICYLGLREPLVQSQVLPYLRQLVSAGVEVGLLTFETGTDEDTTRAQLADRAARLEQEGIKWTSLRYHKRPTVPATLYDILLGTIRTIRLARSQHIDVLHARAHIPLAVALLAKSVINAALVFDLRGLIAEEYADAGILKTNSLVFRAVKWLERAGLRRADQVVVLTQRVRDWLVDQGQVTAERIEVIPTCVDLSRYKVDELKQLSGDRFELIYAGSVVGLYLLEEMGRFFLALKKQQPNAFFRILTLTPQAEVAALLTRVGVSPEYFHVAAVSPEAVPFEIRRARLGISFRKPAFSQIAASPTKIAEYLAAGVPVVSNAGTGDVDEIFATEGVGVTVDGFDEATLTSAALRAIALVNKPDIKERCARTARNYFDLVTVGGKRYGKVYERLASQKERPG